LTACILSQFGSISATATTTGHLNGIDQQTNPDPAHDHPIRAEPKPMSARGYSSPVRNSAQDTGPDLALPATVLGWDVADVPEVDPVIGSTYGFSAPAGYRFPREVIALAVRGIHEPASS